MQLAQGHSRVNRVLDFQGLAGMPDVHTADLADPFQPLHQSVAVDMQILGRLAHRRSRRNYQEGLGLFLI